ncbi:class I SAM-dependent methyltransferase [Halorubrum vacuolatum]|uniref:Demethylmenaquinone methyltransferase / 2-methoxy-6-polyprenyl-1,4-benzoquinol methylase n=1 Tax=Halorubrum vacuolatum TaxID=63740 RepID=A0A238WVS0_HALVU|nr:class I SAM-dependent methyltransferase [Halorubrum vacuolatum]SNR50528.1 demethylmenaquinone methyltransferase / 2-methoxy-6-polyprenyl-1,4-benzoquinol methylase [Halorubrum vacuolatum]
MFGPGDLGFFERVAPLYDLVMPPASGTALADGLAHAERPIERLLDVGGGSGRAAAAITGPEVTVVDASPRMLGRARRVRGLDAMAGDASRLPVRDDAVDAVMIVDALHHFPDADATLAEVARVLAPGGVLVVREFDPTHPLGRAIELGEELVGMQSTFFSPDRLADDLAPHGFRPSVIERGFGYTVVGVRLDGSMSVGSMSVGSK